LDSVEEVITPVQAVWARHVHHIYAIRAQDRDAVLRLLADKGIGCGVHYPVPIHLQEAYRTLGYQQGVFPVAERCAAEFISLPMFPELTSTQIETVTEAVKEAVAYGVAV
jgi:dTDP-4-amino-4,6-dideoxygalactose transaminase